MRKPPKIIVGVSQRIDLIADYNELRDSLDQRFVEWLIQADFIPVPVPNGLTGASLPAAANDPSALKNWLMAVKPNAIILSGGNDIGEYPERDTTEMQLLSWAKDNKIPTLGICRGMQIMAVWAGVSLIKVEGHVKSRHEPDFIDRSSDWPESVNSYHNWAIANCPPHFKVLAYAKDGVIEAIRHETLPWEGWMWHPERECPFNIKETIRMKRLFGAEQ